MDDAELLAPVLTRAALFKKDKQTEFKAKVFEMPRLLPKNEGVAQRKKRQDGDTDSRDERERKHNEGPEFDIKRARHEVLKFGLTGFKSQSKRKAQISLAVKLGAKPPKKAHKNYKELLAEKKRSQQISKEKLELKRLGKNQVGAPIVRYKKPKVNKKRDKLGEISKHYGVVNPKIHKKKK